MYPEFTEHLCSTYWEPLLQTLDFKAYVFNDEMSIDTRDVLTRSNRLELKTVFRNR